jgi:hypothetical protein
VYGRRAALTVASLVGIGFGFYELLADSTFPVVSAAVSHPTQMEADSTGVQAVVGVDPFRDGGALKVEIPMQAQLWSNTKEQQ